MSAPVLPPDTSQDVSAYMNERHVVLETWVCYRGPWKVDESIPRALLPRDCSDERLGEAVLSQLASSRIATIDEIRERSAEIYRVGRDAFYKKQDESINEFIKASGYKTQKAYYKNLMMCSVKLDQGIITISPWIHDRLKAWSGLEKGDNNLTPIIIAAIEPPPAIGTALRFAFTRCRARKSF